MVENTQTRLHDVFRTADIDDIGLNPFADISEQVEIVFTERITGHNWTVAAQDLDEALTEAKVILDDARRYRELQGAGFTGSDIADLTRNYGIDLSDAEDDRLTEILDEAYDADRYVDRLDKGDAWRRGYEAGVLETGELYAEALQRHVAALPAQAAVGEPIEQPAIRIIPLDGTYLALVMPTTVAHD